MNLADVISLKYPDEVTNLKIQLGDHGDGVITITKWDVEGVRRPTQSDIDRWEIEMDLPYRQKQALAKRVYPTVGDQLDMMYKDIMNKTTTWQDAISVIKAAHPKPII